MYDQGVLATDMTLQSIREGRRPAAVRVTFIYDPTDPYAVAVDFGPDGEGHDSNVWRFARELVIEGLRTLSGIGDVRFWPVRRRPPRPDAPTTIAMALSSPDGDALFHIHRESLVAFLRRTFVPVPRGSEADHLGLDQELMKLLGG